MNFLKWFNDNVMKANPDKLFFLLTTEKDNCVNTGGEKVKKRTIEKLLGVTINNRLNFNELYDKTNQKLNALARVSSYMSIVKRKAIMKAYIMSSYLDVSKQNIKS